MDTKEKKVKKGKKSFVKIYSFIVFHFFVSIWNILDDQKQVLASLGSGKDRLYFSNDVFATTFHNQITGVRYEW